MMTQLELMLAIGSEEMDIARMYTQGVITQRELLNVLGERKLLLLREYMETYRM